MSAVNTVFDVVPSGSPVAEPAADGWRSYLRVTTVLFALVHLAAIAGAVYFWSWGGVVLAIASYFVRMVIVTAAYHRYFAHRSFKTSRAFQLVLAVLAQSAGQKGAIWWSSHHRWHHKHSDTPRDVHSARLRGFWYSHVGWVLRSEWNGTDEALVRDLSRYPELRFLNRDRHGGHSDRRARPRLPPPRWSSRLRVGFPRVDRCSSGMARSRSTPSRTSSDAGVTRPRTTRATAGSSRSPRPERAGTTTTTTTRAPLARASAGGRLT